VSLRPLDRSALKVSQACVVLLIVTAFILDLPPLVGFVGLALLVGTVHPPLALFQQLYFRVLRPIQIVRPEVELDDPAPHRFAQGLGAAFLVAASVAFWLGNHTVGWALGLLVAALAGVNLTTDFCAGCFLYAQLARLGILRAAGARSG
jgi:hypothetical protein